MSDSGETAKSVSSSLLQAISSAIKPAEKTDKNAMVKHTDDKPHGGVLGWAKEHKAWLIGGGVVVLGLGLLLLLRKRR